MKYKFCRIRIYHKGGFWPPPWLRHCPGT